MIVTPEYCLRCSRDWDDCKCLWLTADERRAIDAARNRRNATAVAEEAEARQRWILAHGLEGVLR